ncbi:hypothetical protein AB1Y20_017936 [Prymnesium parvum]|uniref:SAM-dependent MTase RsmB/NOP-type domain-containing protein n=1 Tax=Prymnesium parvum TaxID=97485 RepID=A0AB34JPI6_PRYPA
MAAARLAAVLQGASVKSLCHARRAEYALITETLKRRPLLERALSHAGVGEADNPRLHAAHLLLAHEALYGRGLRHAAVRDLARASHALPALRTLLRWSRALLKAKSAAGTRRPPPAAALPRYARVNTLRSSVDGACAALVREGYTLLAAPASPSAPGPGEAWVDREVPSLLVLPPRAELHGHAMVRRAALVLQEKASAMAPVALAPAAGGLVVDACAAPGNKTSQLAALAAEGRVVACERDGARAATLRRRVEEAAEGRVSVRCVDFLQLDPQSEEMRGVESVLLDPSCSGSGIVERGAAHGAAEHPSPSDGAARLSALAAMQLRLLRHALSFPAARAVVYSTCSVHPIENELVVAAALGAARGWRLAAPAALRRWKCRGLPLGGLDAEQCERLVRAAPFVQTNGFFIARFERCGP